MLGNHFLEVSLVRRAHLLVAHRPYEVPFPATGVLAHCAAGHGTVNRPGSLVESGAGQRRCVRRLRSGNRGYSPLTVGSITVAVAGGGLGGRGGGRGAA